ncbi:Mth938-like domain-containing protein [Candidatus Aminicenantes bacterium AC-335-B20]|jgi:hypothetical protein|nr:Mth938-like domain-containing protein [SCandidatus Aminicenantes bacterium Aminicenantia_JdfR_composite]MCP2597423.1 Mth938-like domain-containing protein [Candidatus Aminicenantes bacterium AC-335-G13]MCP2599177.1 Mth938-like domain-containing protein [Candidatus Aminicenantes bacterium AC-335-B20]MCP2620751.1 Mth938-like domain-containing protein [Candidatus Aminicenantes bacterium AC-334-E05]
MIIKSYTFGQMIVNDRKYTSDLIIFPDRIKDSWWRKKGHSLCKEDIKEILSEKPEVLIIGTGFYGIMKVPDDLREFIKEQGIELYIEKTKKAVTLFNEMFQSKKTVGAFHLTC